MSAAQCVRLESLATAAEAWHPKAMSSMPNTAEPASEAPSAPETESERACRLTHEAELVARGRADVAARRVISGEIVEAWVSESARLGRPTERPRRERRLPPGAG